ncbi:SDR family oxidoreductase [Candidatus Wolfebacteria bacterium]|nr:SDR family oxidoreductase [Candidatus Wolfebacteria bacterium]
MAKSNLIIDLTGKVAVVTGGDRGIGEGVVAALIKSGAIVCIACRDLEKVEQAREEYKKIDAEILSVEVDVTNQESVDKMVDEIIKMYGRIDILVNNAGTVGAPGWEKRQEETIDDWKVNYEVNLLGLSRVSNAVAAQMKNKKFGKIINISSTAGRGGNKDHVPSSYGATKAGVINLTQTNALAWAPFNINVNAVCPGIIWTPMWEQVAGRLSIYKDEERDKSAKEVYNRQVSSRIPLGREQTPEDIGNVVAFLSSELSKNITGQSINVNGGIRMN